MRFFQANITDVPRIRKCAEMCCREHGSERMGGELDWEHYLCFLLGLFAHNHAAMFLYEDAGEIVGGMAVGMARAPLTGLWLAQQIFLYAKPEYRGLISVRRLVRECEHWAKDVAGCRNMVMPLLDTMPAKTEDFYLRLGYREQQTNYLKKLV
jgi:hypothetical protein